MNISNSQVNRLRHFVRAGLRSLFRPEPQTAVEWADANYYLPKESAYQEGRWETLPFQRAIMNAMGSDYIREVNVVKSARVGYGCIQDADAQREGINASARYPKNWVTTGDPAREFTMIQSAPLMLLADPDEFVSVQLA
ncbi:hypothetical protein GQE95_20385 [Escherichia coli]|nr:major capsid protein [Escherichia coli]EFC9760202.1 hypothetical protein [Escherichia coli]EFH4241127.1 hypothetical protein [Escherichia coli]MWC52610.1 hypothetical protein [Escherichia coli]HBA3436592.1 hypothetical protein [Escherichia coli]